jgi:hypothetical protein
MEAELLLLKKFVSELSDKLDSAVMEIKQLKEAAEKRTFASVASVTTIEKQLAQTIRDTAVTVNKSRDCQLVISGIDELSNVADKVSELVKYTNPSKNLRFTARRLGTVRDSVNAKPRLTLVTFNSAADANIVLANKSSLRDSEDYGNQMFIQRFLTKTELAAEFMVREERRRKQTHRENSRRHHRPKNQHQSPEKQLIFQKSSIFKQGIFLKLLAKSERRYPPTICFCTLPPELLENRAVTFWRRKPSFSLVRKFCFTA